MQRKRIEVRSQVEFDACVAAGHVAIVIGCRVVARENSSVEARENSSVVARGNSSVEAWENSSVVAWGNSSVEAWGNSSVVARGNSSVVAWENSSVVARENSSVVAWENSSVEAWENSSVEAWENSSVEAWENSSVVARGNVIIRLFGALSITASAFVTIVMHSQCPNVTGGRQLQVPPEPRTGAEWCDANGIDRNKVPYVVPSLDAAILHRIDADESKFDMSGWHGQSCDLTNWCNTTHCRAGFAICLAGHAGFDLERKYGAELAGRMIYAVSCPDLPLPDFFASNEDAIADMRQRAAASGK